MRTIIIEISAKKVIIMNKLFLMLAVGLLSTNSVDTKKVTLVEPIKLGGVHLFSVRGVNCSKRADMIYDRLRYVLVPSLEASDIVVGKVKGQAVILINDNVLVTITDEDAKLNKSTKFGLANQIQEKLSKNLPDLVPLESK